MSEFWKKHYDEFVEFGKEFADKVNLMGPSEKERGAALAEGITHSHRTLQQSAIGVMFHCLLTLGETPENQTDLRNKASIGACRKLKELVEAGEIDVFYPFI